MFVASLLLVAQAASGQTPSAKPTPDPDKRICRREMATGSNMSRSVCHTRAQWDAIARANTDSMERLRGPNAVRPSGN